MEQKIRSYNDAKLKEIEQEIADISAGSKLPFKFLNEEGKIKKILLHQQTIFPSGIPNNYIYIKIPEIPFIPFVSGEHNPSVEFNLKVVQNKAYDAFSRFKVVIYFVAVDNFKCNIDNTHNALKIISTNSNIVYYLDEEEKKHFYVKLYLNSLGTTQSIITLFDISTDSYIPEDFSTTDMIISTLPGTETQSNNITQITNPYMNAAQKINSISMYVLTNGTNNPGVTHQNLYPGTSNNWASRYQLSTDPEIYAWKYTVE
jgi:hypothetical protein